jgi:hypothetical protein
MRSPTKLPTETKDRLSKAIHDLQNKITALQLLESFVERAPVSRRAEILKRLEESRREVIAAEGRVQALRGPSHSPRSP